MGAKHLGVEGRAAEEHGAAEGKNGQKGGIILETAWPRGEKSSTMPASKQPSACPAQRLAQTAVCSYHLPMIEFTLNGVRQRIEVEPDTPLLWVLRDELG